MKPGDVVEIPLKVTVGGWGIADIISRAVFKIVNITAVLEMFNPEFK